MPFAPRLDILPPPQRRLWDEFDALPPAFTLYGGTAIALPLGHRASVDFDFFGAAGFDPRALAAAFPFLRRAVLTKPLPQTEEMKRIAARVIWFEPPEKALGDPARFLAYAMHRATHEDMQTIRTHVSDDDFRAAIDAAPPGIVDPRSWAYWNLVLGRHPAPPMPVRTFD